MTEAKVEVVGSARPWVMPGWVKALQAVTGYLVLRWLVVLAARHVLGLATEVRVSFDGQRLRLGQTARLLGRVVRESEELVQGPDVLAIGIEKQYPQLVLLAGALGLLLGSIVGVGWVIDGIQASYVPIALFGLGVLAAGVAFDIGFGALADHLGARVGLLITVRPTGRGIQLMPTRFRVVGVSEESARRLVQEFSGAP